MNTPVLLVVYKRPDLTRRALDAIAASKPSRLFVAADGARTSAEAEACRITRAAVAEFKGECEVVTNFSDENLGCGIRVYTAIDWAFSLSEELIIIEDDCLPNASFFRFCEEMLAFYRDDERVMHVSGDNFVGPELSGSNSYYFSKYTHAWGWATWKRAWRHFDWKMSRWPELKQGGLIESWCSDPYEQRYWTEIFDRMCGGAPDVWDYMWMFACWSQWGLSVLPSVNLVRNDGWGPDATHTHHPMSYPLPEEIDRIEHPRSIVRNIAADTMSFDLHFGGAHLRALDSPRARLRRRIDPLLKPARFVKRAMKLVIGRS
jgi:hypothetical protein